MLKPRIIPCLLVHNKGLVKTEKFKNPKYVGDPINAVKIFNEKEVDELMVIDIDASVQKREPDFTLIRNLAIECRMPFCYGGGVKTVDHARKIISLGAEKVAVSSAALSNPKLLAEIAMAVGSQSVILVLDIKKSFLGNYEVMINNGTRNTGVNLLDFCRQAEELGVGEIVINSIDNDGMMKGYDQKLIEKVRNVTTVPLTVLGGAGSIEDLGQVISKYRTIGVAAGSMFVFKGKYKAVLISYPSKSDKEKLFPTN